MAVFTNQATLSYSGGVTNSNVTTGELVEAVSVTKDAVSDSYTPGEKIAYAVNIVNNGATPLTGLTVTDDLGSEPVPVVPAVSAPLAYEEGSLLYFADGVRQADPSVSAGPPLQISGISIPAGSNATFVYEAAVTPYAPLGSGASVTNTVTVSGTGMTTLTAESTVPMAGEPRLTISKCASAAQVSVNGELSYRFVIQNSGSEAADETDAVVLTDVFDPVLNNLSVTFNGAPWAETTNYVYDQTTGTFSTVSGQITVPAAQFAQNADGTWTVTPGVSELTVTGTV